ncbi:hypothetical protein AVEN_183830-1 [Araneus ventricosus]|uniref:CCHC-type domain-containing protein n=1 Tax=Araneus ventricosus TaxID=182803 RepID=A0A4Y2N7V7_ARAVE|nr:hypothetical protein AVEN_183830-1 [Araneus ventricosus]
MKRISSQNENFHSVSPFLVQKGINSSIGDVKSIRNLRSVDLLIEISSRKQAQQIVKLNALSTLPVTVGAHSTFNSSKGVVTCGELFLTPTEEIAEDLKCQGVTHVRRIKIRREGKLLDTKHLVLTFHSPKLSQSIKTGYMNLAVKPYIPNPLRCFKCQRFGHSKVACRGTLACALCGEKNHDSLQCTTQEKCANCKGNHAYSRSCPSWQFEKVNSVKIKQQISYPEARKIVKAQTPTGGTSYSAAIKQSILAKVRQINPTDTMNDSTTSEETLKTPKILNICIQFLIYRIHLLFPPQGLTFFSYTLNPCVGRAWRPVRDKMEAWGSSAFPSVHSALLPSIPKSVRIAYLNSSVRPYIPNPLRCFKCQRFGHTVHACRGIQSCTRCSLPGHDSQTCSETPCCINCKSDHPAYSKTFPRWKIEKEIQTVKIKQNLSFKEARKIVMDRTPSVGVSYSAITKGLMVSSSTQISPEIQSQEKINIPTPSQTKPISQNRKYMDKTRDNNRQDQTSPSKLNKEESRTFHTLDLAICSPSLAIQWDFSVADDLHNSDHFPIILSYSDDDVTYPERPKRYIFNKADWTLFSQMTLISKQLVEKESIDDVVYEITDILMTAADAAIPKTSRKIPKNWKPWWNAECGIADKKQTKGIGSDDTLLRIIS